MRLKRIEWLDFAKGFTILFVVITHCIFVNKSGNIQQNNLCQMLVYYINTFIMPLFFAVSGFLYKKIKDVHEYFIMLYKKIMSLLIPYFIFSIIFIYHSKNIFINSWKQPYEYLWFLYALFFIFVIVGILDLLKISFIIQLIIYIICELIQMCLPWWQGISISAIPSILGYVLFFYIGYLIHYSKLGNCLLFLRNKYLITYLIIIALIIFVQMNFTGKTFNTDRVYYTDIITKILSVLIIFPIFTRVKHNKIFNYFTKYGKFTLIIYLVHFPIRFLVGNHLIMHISLLNQNTLLGSIVLFIFTYIISMFICYLAEKFKIINFIFYPRKQYISKWLKKTNLGKKFLGDIN